MNEKDRVSISAKLGPRAFVKPRSLLHHRREPAEVLKAHPPELKKLMDKKLSLTLSGGRHVQEMLQGLDPFMNLVIGECVEMVNTEQRITSEWWLHRKWHHQVRSLGKSKHCSAVVSTSLP